MIALRAEALLLNAALGVGIGLLVSWGTKKITEAAQRVQNVATESKEAADAAQSTTSSLKDLVSAYEELGDKSGWGTEDFDQAKDIQAEILDLAKEQGTLDENKLGKLDLQNGKYEEQLGLLQDITAEQLEASRYELTQNKDAQGDKLVDTAKKNNRTHYLTVWSAPEMDMGDQIKNAGIDVFNKFGGYGPDDLNDADFINMIIDADCADLIDIEFFTAGDDIRELIDNAHSSGVVVVCSSHDFQKTPDKNELVSRMVKMQQVGADLPKVAVMPHDSTDVLTLLAATVEMKDKYFATPIITISMGRLGVASRLCGEVFGSSMTFASAGDSSAPGQIGLDIVNAVLDSIAE